MNKSKRERIREAIRLIDRAAELVEITSDAEQDSLDNLPENLQYSARAERMEESVDSMDSAMEELSSAKEHMESAVNDLCAAIA